MSPRKKGAPRFEIRTASNPSAIIPAIRDTVAQLDSNLPVFGIKTQSEQIERSLFQERLIARLSSIFGGLSLVLACVGLYGLLSYEVARRRNEIGIRMALGATQRDVLWFLAAQGLVLAAVGVAIGVLAAFGLTRYVASLLYGVRSADPATFAAVALLLTVLAILACTLPARRAMRVDPVIALRYE
jgi:ABC-type antimicrobial peptide transport system permease subunit